MIAELFQTAKPLYISIQDGDFFLNDQHRDLLEVKIHDMIPVRKLFRDRQLECYSLDNTTGKAGQYCALCRNRYRCRQRLRLMLLVYNVTPDPLPAVLEISPASFDSLDALIQNVGQNQLPNTLVIIRIAGTVGNRLTLEFLPAS